MNTLLIASALRALADALEAPADVIVQASAAVSSAPTAAPTVEAPATGTSCSPDEKVYTDSDLRTALTQASTRLGSKEKVVELLQKYAGKDKPPIVASIAVADYGKVIAECASLS